MFSVEIDPVSYKGLQADLQKYGKDAEKAVTTAVLKTALSIETIAKQRLRGMFGSAKHWITGRLASSLHYEMTGKNSFKGSKDSQPGDGKLNETVKQGEAIVGTNVDYAMPIEFGSRPHIITPKNAKVLAFKIGGKLVFAKKVNHPGFKGESFLRYAAEVEDKKFAQRIEEELNKLAK